MFFFRLSYLCSTRQRNGFGFMAVVARMRERETPSLQVIGSVPARQNFYFSRLSLLSFLSLLHLRGQVSCNRETRLFPVNNFFCTFFFFASWPGIESWPDSIFFRYQ